MRAQLLALCLRAYPREVRERDGDVLRDLAVELSDDHGTLREACSLLRGGLAARTAQCRPVRVRVVAAALGCACLAVGLLGIAGTTEVEVEVEMTELTADP